MPAPSSNWDPGGQPERTELAWQRTALSGLVCGLVVSRLLARHSTVLGLVLATLSVLTALATLTFTRVHYRHANAALLAHTRLPDARVKAAVVALILVTGFGAGAYTVLSWTLTRFRS